MNKKLVQRLLSEGHITKEEALSLLLDTETVETSLEQIKNIIEETINKLFYPLPGMPVTVNPVMGSPIPPRPSYPFDFEPYSTPVKTYGDICPCNPKNGGNGVCHCVMANTPLDQPVTIGPGTNPYTFTTSSSYIFNTGKLSNGAE